MITVISIIPSNYIHVVENILDDNLLTKQEIEYSGFIINISVSSSIDVETGMKNSVSSWLKSNILSKF